MKTKHRPSKKGEQGMSIRMNGVRVFFLLLYLLCVLSGCGKTDLSNGTSEFESEVDCLMQNTENAAKNNLDNWIGRYAFSEVISESTEELRDYDITIYEEGGQYYENICRCRCLPCGKHC